MHLLRRKAEIDTHTIVGVGYQRVGWLDESPVLNELADTGHLHQIALQPYCLVVPEGRGELGPRLTKNGHVLRVIGEPGSDLSLPEDHVMTKDVKAEGRRWRVRNDWS